MFTFFLLLDRVAFSASFAIYTTCIAQTCVGTNVPISN